TAIDDHQTAALIGAASYRHDSRQAALRAQYEAAPAGIRAEFLAEVAKIQNGEGEAAAPSRNCYVLPRLRFCRLKDFRRIATRYDKTRAKLFSAPCFVANLAY